MDHAQSGLLRDRASPSALWIGNSSWPFQGSLNPKSQYAREFVHHIQSVEHMPLKCIVVATSSYAGNHNWCHYSDLGGGGWGPDLLGYVTVDGSSDQASVRCNFVLHNARKSGIQARFTIELGAGSELLEEFLDGDPHGQGVHLSHGSQPSKER
ncbi:MAG: hypothetical protein ACI8PQ_001761 [Planctomycetota bacterium]|jgi:hypothetical protein